MTTIVLDTEVLLRLADRVEEARLLLVDLDGHLQELGAGAGRFGGPSAAVAGALHALEQAVAGRTRDSRDDLVRVRDSLQALAGLWTAVEGGGSGTGTR